MKLRIKEVASKKGFNFQKLAQRTGIDPVSLSRYNVGAVEAPLSKLQIIADALGCELIELIQTGPNYAHFEVDGEWLGIRRK